MTKMTEREKQVWYANKHQAALSIEKKWAAEENIERAKSALDEFIKIHNDGFGNTKTAKIINNIRSVISDIEIEFDLI